MFVYELPEQIKIELSELLDENNKWIYLAVYVGCKKTALLETKLELKRGRSPSMKLLHLWGHKNKTVVDLFITLSKMKNFLAMEIIKGYVEEKYHYLLKQRTQVISNRWVQRLPAVPNVLYDDLQAATDNWNENNIIGRGTFSVTYKGYFKSTVVAIKKIHHCQEGFMKNNEIAQTLNEIHWLNIYHHDNLLPLYFYCLFGVWPCLIFKYMSNGCLENRLEENTESRLLHWSSRHAIAVGVARGLQYLHRLRTQPLIHCKIKSSTIFLDQYDTPRIGGFRFANNCDGNTSNKVPTNSMEKCLPYWPRHFGSSEAVSTKIDVYSFGIVLFELATGLNPHRIRETGQDLKDLITQYSGNLCELKDGKISGGDEFFLEFVKIGNTCVATRPENRPEIINVLEALENIKK